MDFSIYDSCGILHLVSVDHITDLSEEVSPSVIGVKLRLNREVILLKHVQTGLQAGRGQWAFLCHVSGGNAVFIFSFFLHLQYPTLLSDPESCRPSAKITGRIPYYSFRLW